MGLLNRRCFAVKDSIEFIYGKLNNNSKNNKSIKKEDAMKKIFFLIMQFLIFPLIFAQNNNELIPVLVLKSDIPLLSEILKLSAYQLQKKEVDNGKLHVWVSSTQLSEIETNDVIFEKLKFAIPIVNFSDANSSQSNTDAVSPQIFPPSYSGDPFVGSEITIYLNGRNASLTSWSNDVGYVTMSLPDFCNVNSFGGDSGWDDIYKATCGNTIWTCFDYGVSASNVLVDGLEDGWSILESKTIWAKVTPTQPMALDIYSKMNIGDLRDPSGGCQGPDQQYWPVNHHAIPITLPTAPDLIVQDIWIDPSNPCIGDNVDLYATIKNVGNASADNIKWWYYIDNIQIDDDTYGSLDPGESVTEHESNYVFTSSGSHQYKVWVEPVSNESNTSNNTRTETVYAYNCNNPPTITRLSPGNPYSCNEDTEVTFSAEVYEPDGESDFDKVEWRIDEILEYTDNYSSILWSNPHTSNFDYTFYDPGSYIVEARVFDDAGLNNAVSWNVTVNNIAPDLTISELYIEAAPFETNKNFDIHTTIQNVGNQQSDATTIYYFIDGFEVASDGISSLSPGASDSEYDNNHSVSTAGDHTITIVVTSVSGEEVTSNNQYSVSYNFIDPNLPPTIALLSPSTPHSCNEDTEQIFSAEVYEPNGESDFDKVEWRIDGILEWTDPHDWLGWSNPHVSEFPYTFYNPGSYVVEARVFDDAGLNNAVSWNVTVNNIAPDLTISELYIEAAPFETNKNFDIYTTIQNVGNQQSDATTIYYFIDGFEVASDAISSLSPGATDSEYDNNHSVTTPGDHTITVAVTSVSGEEVTSNNQYSVTYSFVDPNLPPSITIIAPNNPFICGIDVEHTFSTEVYEPNGESDFDKVEWRVNGILEYTDNYNSITWSNPHISNFDYTFYSPEAYIVEARVFDDLGGNNFVTWDVTVSETPEIEVNPLTFAFYESGNKNYPQENVTGKLSKSELLSDQLKGEYKEKELLIKYISDIDSGQITEFEQQNGIKKIKKYHIVNKLYHYIIIDEEPIENKLTNIIHNSQIEFAEPNSIIHTSSIVIPDDPGFDGLYGMHNTGQSWGVVDADIDAPEAWSISTGSSTVVVGVIDSGIDDDHPDLVSNMWTNLDEIPNNGIDDDDNGYIDDIHGWDWAYNDNEPTDFLGHGTHVAGTIGAVGNNNIGVTGVCWNVRLMALKFINDNNAGNNADAISAMEYAADNGADLTNNSWGGGLLNYSQSVKEAIINSDILFVAAAGNDGNNIDDFLHYTYPANYDCENMIVVASLFGDNTLAYNSNWGTVSVDIGAYGVLILSTKPDNATLINFGLPGLGLSSNEYGVISGTSMATPQVSGVAALLLANNSNLSWQQVKDAILNNADPLVELASKVVTGGKLNAYNALTNTTGSGDSFIISNLFPGTLSINDIQENEAWISTSGYPNTPFNIPFESGQYVGITIDWSLLGNSTETSSIEIHSNDPDEPIVAISVTAIPSSTLVSYNTPEGLWKNTNPIFDIDFEDGSGLNNLWYQIDSNDDTDPANWHHFTSDGSTMLPESQNCPGTSMNSNWLISDADWNSLPFNVQNQGVYHIYFKVTDDVGNTFITLDENAAFEFRKDIYPPDVTVSYPTPGLVHNSSEITTLWNSNDIIVGLSLSGVDKVYFKLNIEGSYHEVDGSVNSSTYNGLPDGLYTFYIYATDIAGNISNEIEVDFEIDTQINPPTPFALTLPNIGDITSITPLLQWQISTDPDGTQVEYKLYYSDNIGYNNQTIESNLTSNNFQFDGSNQLYYDQQYYWKVKAIDGNGQERWCNQLNWWFQTETDPNPPYITLTPASQNVTHDAGIYPVSVVSNVNWTVSESCDWLNCTPLNGSNDGSFTVTYTENTFASSRSCDLTVSGGGVTEIHTIYQEGMTNCELSVNPESYDFGEVLKDECSDIVTFTISNSGSAAANGVVSLTGSNMDQFNIVSGGGSFNIPSGESKDVIIEFCPTSSGQKYANLFINGANPCNDINAYLTGYCEQLPTVNAGPDATTCEGIEITLFGLAENYSSVLWSGGSGSFGDPTSLTPTYVPATGEYGFIELCLTAYPIPPGTEPTIDCMQLFIQPLPEVGAGVDFSACDNVEYIQLDANAVNYNEVQWITTGEGFFDDESYINTKYYPLGSDLTNGYVELCLKAWAIGPCQGFWEDCITITFIHSPVADAGEDVTICQGDNYQITGAAAGYFSSLIWSTSGDGTFSSNSVINPVYTPGTGDMNSGSVQICLEAFSLPGCTSTDENCMWLDIIPPSYINLPAYDSLECEFYNFNSESWLPIYLDYESGNYTSLLWSTIGDGTFYDPTGIPAFYSLGENDQLSGEVTLSVEVSNECSTVTAEITLYIPRQIIYLDDETEFVGVSSYLDLIDMTVPEVLAPIKDCLSWFNDEDGNYYWPAANVNQLGNWQSIGYRAQVDCDCCLPLYGEPLEDCSFEVFSYGIDDVVLLPVLCDTPVEIEQLFAGYLNQIHYIIDLETSDLYLPGVLSSLTHLYPGKAYELLTSGPATFTIEFPCSSLPETYTISTSANPPEGGETSGDGEYEEGETVSVEAINNPEWIFVNWDDNGVLIDENPYTFEIFEDHELIANFIPIGPPEITLTPESYDFGEVLKDECSDHVTFTISNSGSAAATGVVSLTGSNMDQFNIVSGGGSFNIPSGSNEEISIEFCPTSVGAKSANLFINGAIPCNDIIVPLAGEGIIQAEVFTTILPEGWSGLSSFIVPANAEAEAIFQSIISDLIILQSGSDVYWPAQNINTVGLWDSHKGYLIKVANAVELNISGLPVDDKTLLLTEGWNLIPVISRCGVSVVGLFDGTDVILVKEVAGPNIFWPAMTITTLDELLPGKSYYVLMDSPTEITFPICSGLQWHCGELFIDTRDSHTYSTVEIGSQCWMAENLNIGSQIDGVEEMTENETIEKYCYNDDSTNCEIYGGLYQWDEIMQYATQEGAQGICPNGWHVPPSNEFCELSQFLDSLVNCEVSGYTGIDAGGKLKATGTIEAGTGFWQEPNLGASNESGFTAIPAGKRWQNGSFGLISILGGYWSSTMYNNYSSRLWACRYNESGVSRGYDGKGLGWSVRCIKDIENLIPNQPFSPIPENGAVNCPRNNNLYWSCSDPDGDPLTYDVYFGIENTPPQIATGLADTIYPIETLAYNTTYHWQIIAYDDNNNFTEGPVWSFTTEEESTGFVCGDILIDPRGGQEYGTVQIGDQCWMDVNLAYLPEVSPSSDGNNTDSYYYVYDYQGTDVATAKATDNYQNYGALYNWPASLTACPSDWHLPTDAEWIVLTDYLGGTGVAGGKMKSARTAPESHPRWSSPNTGATNSSGFTGLPGGYRSTNGSFSLIGYYGYFWSSTDGSTTNAWNRYLEFGYDNAYRGNYNKDIGFSVRCINGTSPGTNQPPYIPSTPNPENGSQNLPTETELSWSCTDPDNDPLTYDVYFGIENTPPQLVTGIEDTFYIPETLEYSTTYYWKIVAHDDQVNTTEGEVWSFTTETRVWDCGEPIVDGRDGNEYQTVQIGDQCWMSENIAWLPEVSPPTEGSMTEPYYYVYDYQGTNVVDAKSTQNYQNFGALYNWSASLSVCPEGWHLATDDEWKILEGTVDSQYPVGDPIWNQGGWRGYDAGTNLRSDTGWMYNGNGSNLYNFSGLPGGIRFGTPSFEYLGIVASFWTITESGISNSYDRNVSSGFATVGRGNPEKNTGKSVRCMKNQENSPPITPTDPFPENGAENHP